MSVHQPLFGVVFYCPIKFRCSRNNPLRYLINFRTSRLLPVLTAFLDTFALPSAVLAPVDCFQGFQRCINSLWRCRCSGVQFLIATL